MLLLCLVVSWVRDRRPCHLWRQYGPGQKAGRLSLQSPDADNHSVFSGGSGGGSGAPDPNFGTERERTLSGAEADDAGEYEHDAVFNTISSTMQPPVQTREVSRKGSLELA